jgi:membrane protease YdiL (CAAX protease family)
VWAAVLYASAHAPTLWALRDPKAGLNPLLVAAALAAGLVWGAMTRYFERLPPAIVAHALFDWALVMMFRLWGQSV